MLIIKHFYYKEKKKMKKQIHIYYINKIKERLMRIYDVEDVATNEIAINRYLDKAGIINKELRQELLRNIVWSDNDCKGKLEKLGWKVLTGCGVPELIEEIKHCSIEKWRLAAEQIKKDLDALNIIKEKNVDIEYIKTCFDDEKGGFKEYNDYMGHDEDYELAQEEYELLKEVLEE